MGSERERVRDSLFPSNAPLLQDHEYCDGYGHGQACGQHNNNKT